MANAKSQPKTKAKADAKGNAGARAAAGTQAEAKAGTDAKADACAFPKNHRIMAQAVAQNNDTRVTGLNNNDLIIGPTGAGKTRGYVIPNILHDNDESLVIVDTKGNLRKIYGGYLKSKGYLVKDIDFVDCLHSRHGYDPLRLIQRDKRTGRYSEQDILRVSAALCPVTSLEEPYWEQAAQMTLSALIGLTLERFVPADRSMATVCQLAVKLGTRWLNDLFEDLAVSDPQSFAVREYRLATMNANADRTISCVNGMLANALQPASFNGAMHLYKGAEQVDFAQLGHKKTALFVTVSDNDRSLDRLVNIFYTQALQELVREADKQPGNCLPVPVRLILDDFATNTVIPDFDKVITTIRSRGIAVSLIVQDLSQLEALYGPAKGLIIANNCDNWLYLGGHDGYTARVMSLKMNKPVEGVMALGLDETMLFRRGSRPLHVSKYQLQEDPTYLQWAEGSGSRPGGGSGARKKGGQKGRRRAGAKQPAAMNRNRDL